MYMCVYIYIYIYIYMCVCVCVCVTYIYCHFFKIYVYDLEYFFHLKVHLPLITGMLIECLNFVSVMAW